MTKSNILLIYTGGTIGMIKEPDLPYLKPFNFKNILEKVREIKLLNCNIETISIKDPIDSSNISIDNWIELIKLLEENYSKFDGFVILHGTDTMSYTASALSFLIQNLSKPIILTGSQLPLGDLRTDAKEHIITSIQLAANDIKIKEVCLYFDNKLYRGNRTTKVNSEQFKAYASFNYPELANSGVDLIINQKNILCSTDVKTSFHKKLNNKVSVLKLFPGISKNIVKHLFSDKCSKVIIIESFGSGNIFNDSWFLEELKKSMDSGKFIVNVSQCPKGTVKMGKYESSEELIKLGVISGKDITIESAICKSMFLLAKNLKYSTFKQYFEQDLSGEIS
ncbi:MAG: asparaginase [Flavobacteriaceae bacterium]|nr:asparaginase [Flavobacteriaceae bacterium]